MAKSPFQDVPRFEDPAFDLAQIPDAGDRAFAEDLRRDGYAEIDLGAEGLKLCDAVVAETDPIFADGTVSRVQDAWLKAPAVRQLATLPVIEQRLRAAFGREPFPFQTLNFHQGSQQKIHSDLIHFSSKPERFMCGVWIALEDVEADAGPLAYYPGSHKLPTPRMCDIGVKGRSSADDYPKFEAEMAERMELSNLPRRNAIIPKGRALVWASNLAHGGEPIAREGSTRRSLVVHFYFEDCLYFTPLMSDEEKGRLFVRVPANLKTGWITWPRRNGRPAAPSPGAIFAIGRVLTRRPYVAK